MTRAGDNLQQERERVLEASSVESPARRFASRALEVSALVLLPVYVFDVKWNGEKYSFAVNGQTGKVVGTLPEDAALKRKYFWKWAAIGAAVIMAANWLLFLQ